jgi:hypothetical protein
VDSNPFLRLANAVCDTSVLDGHICRFRPLWRRLVSTSRSACLLRRSTSKWCLETHWFTNRFCMLYATRSRRNRVGSRLGTSILAPALCRCFVLVIRRRGTMSRLVHRRTRGNFFCFLCLPISLRLERFHIHIHDIFEARHLRLGGQPCTADTLGIVIRLGAGSPGSTRAGHGFANRLGTTKDKKNERRI